jgi:hypothetical protein
MEFFNSITFIINNLPNKSNCLFIELYIDILLVDCYKYKKTKESST